MPEHIRDVSTEGIRRIKLIDATPIGINVRSTVATYAGVHDELRKLYAKSEDAKIKAIRQGIFRTIQAHYVVRVVTVQVLSVLTYNSPGCKYPMP